MSTIEHRDSGSVRILGRKVGRVLTARELASVAGGSGRTGPIPPHGTWDTDYS